MANPEHLAKLLEGGAAWNEWREANPATKADLVGANLEKANLREANLQGALVSGANLQGASLFRANLQDASLEGANLRGVDLTEANLQNANLRHANLLDANVTGIKFDPSSLQRNFKGIRVATCYGSQMFKTFAQDQDFIEDLRDFGRWGEVKFRLWRLFADCGRGFIRWGLWSLVVPFLFAIIYYCMGVTHMKPDSLPFSLITMVYYSMVTFTTLGFGDVKPQTELAAMVVTLEVILGYIMLGGLVAILANKMARRS